MSGFIVFEYAPPVQWKPTKETYRGDVLSSTRYVWFWFSVTFVRNTKWTDFLKVAATNGAIKDTTGHDEHEDNLGIG